VVIDKIVSYIITQSKFDPREYEHINFIPNSIKHFSNVSFSECLLPSVMDGHDVFVNCIITENNILKKKT